MLTSNLWMFAISKTRDLLKMAPSPLDLQYLLCCDLRMLYKCSNLALVDEMGQHTQGSEAL